MSVTKSWIGVDVSDGEPRLRRLTDPLAEHPRAPETTGGMRDLAAGRS